jgi:hypothetical protein
MALSEKQKKIIAWMGDEEKTKQQIVEQFGHWYYHNGYKYIGELLHRMIEAGKMKRVRRGVYKVPDIYDPKKEEYVDPNQLKLFK